MQSWSLCGDRGALVAFILQCPKPQATDETYTPARTITSPITNTSEDLRAFPVHLLGEAWQDRCCVPGGAPCLRQVRWGDPSLLGQDTGHIAGMSSPYTEVGVGIP